MSMYRSFESTQGYRPLLPKKSNTPFWVAIALIAVAAATIWCFSFYTKRTTPPTMVGGIYSNSVAQLTTENDFLKLRLGSYQQTLLDLTNKIDYLYALYQEGSSNQLNTLSNMILLTEENNAIRVENALLLKKLQSTNK